VSGPLDRGDDVRLRFDTAGMFCLCGGAGVVTDAADMGGGWWTVTWLTRHRPGCPGRRVPERAYLIDEAAFAAGDIDLPGLDRTWRRP
jgi:hypothetical protein